jgi:PAT family beta-lactamase induction signal transducer AmpG
LEYRAIGFFAWVGLSFSFKACWAPFVDRLRIPFIGRLGQRRSWLLVSQFGIAAGLLVMSMLEPSTQTRAGGRLDPSAQRRHAQRAAAVTLLL